ncbi:hypothetical protein FGLOB1_5006 [Fusarium globosum]|uniref:Uncharacterized protein n=1 Tax=Fusarium globosum TaxID=78864 RepID=A0A8H5YF78_9HYPO|nr:hypothetical protein FGLOB1_5006 [Fusarium globosum]
MSALNDMTKAQLRGLENDLCLSGILTVYHDDSDRRSSTKDDHGEFCSHSEPCRPITPLQYGSFKPCAYRPITTSETKTHSLYFEVSITHVQRYPAPNRPKASLVLASLEVTKSQPLYRIWLTSPFEQKPDVMGESGFLTRVSHSPTVFSVTERLLL